jgi:hypothetical protein
MAESEINIHIKQVLMTLRAAGFEVTKTNTPSQYLVVGPSGWRWLVICHGTGQWFVEGPSSFHSRLSQLHTLNGLIQEAVSKAQVTER